MQRKEMKTTQHSAIKPLASRPSGEYTTDMVQHSAGKSTIPSKAGVGGALIDGPYGGKKPVS